MLLSLYEMAKLIPREYRQRILLDNLIYKALAQPSDPHMRALFVIWENYIDTSGTPDLSCSYCLSNILRDYRELQPFFVQLEKESSLLDEL